MKHGKIRAGVVAAAAAGLVAALSGSAVAQQAPTTTAPTAPAPIPNPNSYTHFRSATFKAQSAKPKHLTAAVQMTKDDTAPTRGFTAPTSMVADPENPRIIVAAVANLRSRTCHLLRSRDAGRTWHFSKALPAPSSYPYCTSLMSAVPEASIAWGRNHTLYYGLQAYDIRPGEGEREGRTSIAVARSTDLGDTWTATIVDNNRDKPNPAPADRGVTGLVVDTSGPRDVVYVGWSQRYPDAPMDSPLRNPILMVATSTDGGNTFGAPVNVNDFSKVNFTIAGKPYQLFMNTGFGAPFMTVHKGVLLAVTGADFSFNDRPTPPPQAGQGLTAGSWYSYPLPQLVARSTDQGKTWTVSQMGPPIYAGTGPFTGLGWTPKGGPNGTFVAAYAGTPENSSTTGIADLVVQRSIDLGKTWTEPLAIDDDKPEQHSTSFYPQLQVAPNGRVDVVWQDNRDLADFRFHVRYTYSTDAGATWAPNMQVTDRPLDFNFGISFNSDLRYPPGVASTNQYAFIGWADSRLASDLSQTQDAFGANAQFRPLPATKNTTAPIVAAVFGGLVVAGVILLLILLLRRRERPVGPRVQQPQQPVGAA